MTPSPPPSSPRELWRKEASTDQSLQTIRDELSRAERNLRGTMGKVRGLGGGACTWEVTVCGPQAISRGLDAVKKVVEERKLTGVYGPLIENFKCEPRVFTAVEVTAGSRYGLGTRWALSCVVWPSTGSSMSLWTLTRLPLRYCL